MSEKKAEVAEMQARAKELDSALTTQLAGLPNLPHDDVPDGEDENEESRESFVHHYRHQLEENEKEILLDGDMNEIFRYIEAHLPKPVNGERPD